MQKYGIQTRVLNPSALFEVIQVGREATIPDFNAFEMNSRKKAPSSHGRNGLEER